MAVNNGQPGNETTFNTAFMSRTINTNTVGKVDLDEASTTDIKDAQRVINEIADQNGISNQASTDATAKIYSSNNVIANGDNQRVAIGKLDGEFDTGAGHDHDGLNSKQVDAADLANVNNLFAEFQENEFIAASGTSIVVTSDFSGKTAGGDASTAGVLTTNPLNFISIVEKDSGQEIEDAEGDRVYGRLTEAASVWTLSFYTNEAGTETAHSLASQDIKYLYREVFDQNDRPTIGANVAVYDSLSAVADIPDAALAQRGLVSTGAQTFGGVKNFNSRPTVASVDVVDISAAQTVTNKTINTSLLGGGTASTTNQTIMSNNTTVNLGAITRKKGVIYFDDTTGSYWGDDGTTLTEFATGSGGALSSIETCNLADEKTWNVNGGTFTAGSKQTRILNSISGPGSGVWCTLSSNRFTIDGATYPGRYLITMRAPAYRVDRHTAFIVQDPAGSPTFFGGTNAFAGTTSANMTDSWRDVDVNLSASTVFEIQHECQVTLATTGLGVSSQTSATNSVYTTVLIQKIS